MRRRTWIGLLLLVLPIGLVSLPSAESVRAEGNVRTVIRVGLIQSLFRDTSEPLMQVMMRPLKTLLEMQTGMRGQIVASGDARKLGRQLKSEEVQLGVFHGIEFAWARLKTPELKPLLIAVNRHRTLHAHLVVREDCKLTGAADLKGQAVALPRMTREHCRIYLERRCVPPGTTPQKFFGRITTPHDTEDALDDVVDGTVQAAIIDGTDLEAYQKRNPGRAAKLRSLLRSEPFPSAVVAYYPGVISEGLLERFREGMIAAKDTRQGQMLLDLCRISGFEAVPDDYEQLLADIAKAYPPPAPAKR